MMSSLAERITRHYGGDWHGNSGNYPAEGHSRKDRGVSIKDAPDAPNGVVLHVHNGGDAIPELDRLRRDNFLPKFEPKQPAIRKSRAPGVSYFEYPDADGVVACRKKRIDRADGSKDFQWEHPDGRGGWRPGRGCDPLPYRLPDLLSAPADAVVYVAEGERKADKLASWGLVATSSKDLPEDLSIFAGKTVAILPDNDEKGGKIADRLQNDLEGVAGRVVQVMLPGLPPKGDIIDWRGSKEDLQALVKGALNPRPELLPLLSPAEWKDVETPVQQWALDQYIPLRQATYFTGPGSVGKSLLTQMLCTCVAMGEPFLGQPTRQAPTVYVTCEDDADVLHARQKAICAALGIPLGALDGKLHLVSLMGEIGNELCHFDDKGALHPSDRFRQLVATLEHIGARFAALDNVAHLFPEEIARNKVAAQVNLLNRLARDIDGAVLFLGHPNKDGDEYSGSTAWENQVRSRLYMGWANEADPEMRILRRSKSNYSPRGGEISFVWHQGAFARLEDMPASITGELKQTIQASTDNAIFLACLAERNKQQRAVSERASKTFAPTVFAMMPESKRIGKARLEAAMERLFRIGKIERAELWKGADRKPVIGLRETAGNGAVNTMRETRVTGPGGAEKRAGIVGNTHTITNVIPGAAPPGSLAPFEEDGPGLSRVVFAGDEGLDSNGDVIGWNDDRTPRF